MDRDYSGLPVSLQDSMRQYVEEGIRAGGFLTACLENDLVGAVNRADTTNLSKLQAIVKWMYWELPQACWGSVEKVRSWYEGFQLEPSKEEARRILLEQREAARHRLAEVIMINSSEEDSES